MSYLDTDVDLVAYYLSLDPRPTATEIVTLTGLLLGDVLQIEAALNPTMPTGTATWKTETTRDPSPEKRSLQAVRASDIQMRASQWLWETTVDESGDPGHRARWLPLGGLCLEAGREAVGKSTWSSRIAGQVTTGKLPGAFYGIPRAVVIAATEDDWSRTIVPRLVAADADLERVYRVDAIEDGQVSGLTLPRDIHQLTELCQREAVALVILDPLMGAISGALDTHKDAEVRRALEPLSRMAHNAHLTILGLIHVNKSQGNDLLTRLMASRAFSAVARSVLFAAAEESDSGLETGRETFLLGQAKNNLAAKVPHSYRYHIEGVRVGHDAELGEAIWSSRIVIDETATGRIDDLMSAQESPKPKRETTIERAKQWLGRYLAQFGSVSSAIVKAAGVDAGFSEATVKRASSDIGVEIGTVPGSNSTAWSLPSPPVKAELLEPIDPVELLEPIEPLTQTHTNDTLQLKQLKQLNGSETGEAEPVVQTGQPRCGVCDRILHDGICSLCDLDFDKTGLYPIVIPAEREAS